MKRLAKILPDVEELKKLFYLDSSIPNGLRWKIKPCRKIIKDSPVGSKQKTGYYVVNFKYKIRKLHRIIFSIYHNINLTSDQIIDHIDRDPQNNHPNNLRIVTASENNRNTTKRKNTTSEYIGVNYDKSRSKWCSEIKINKKKIFIGRFLTELDAARAYNDYIITHNLSHFNLNQI